MPNPRPPVAAIVIRIVVVGLALSLFFEQTGAGRLLHLEGADAGVMATPAYWISLLAPIFFLSALWSASNALVSMDRGVGFGPAAVCALREIGGCLMIGAFAAIVVQPSLIYLMGNGFREMHGVTLDWNVENLTLALVGFVLILLAREGQKLQSKLDEFV
jgi:hypothetical protein